MTSWRLYIRLLSYLTPYWKAGLLAFFGFLINSATEVGVAKIMQFIIDAINGQDQQAKNFFPILIVSLFLFRGIGTFLGNYYTALISRNLVFTMRTQIFEKILSIPTSFFQTHSSGRISAKLIFDVEQVTSASTESLKSLVRDGLVVIGLLAYLFYTNWRLSLALLVIAPVIGFLVVKASQRMRRISRLIQGSMGNVSHIATEVINGHAVVKSYVGHAYETKRFNQVSMQNLRQGMKMVVTASLNTPITQLVLALAMSVLVWVALRPSIFGDTSAGEFVAFIAAVALLSKPMKALTEVNEKLQRGLAAANSVFEVLDFESERDEGRQEPVLRGMIELKEVSLQYPDGQWAIKQFNLTIQPGQTIALVGRSGAGKTSLVNLLQRFYELSAGEIYFDGIAGSDIKLNCLRRQIATVGQQVVLFDGSVRDNIAYGDLQQASDAEVLDAAKFAYADEFIQDLPHKYETAIGPNGFSLSGGQRQRLAIARALLKNAPILILDEATSALDNESEHYIQEALDHIVQNRTTIVIAHRLSTIEQADVIVVMDEGEIVAQGTHQQLLVQDGLYAQLYHRNFQD